MEFFFNNLKKFNLIRFVNYYSRNQNISKLYFVKKNYNLLYLEKIIKF